MVNSYSLDDKKKYDTLMSILSNIFDYSEINLIHGNESEIEPTSYPCIAVITDFELLKQVHGNTKFQVISFAYPKHYNLNVL